MSVGLVLGAGGVMGGAWITGALETALVTVREQLRQADNRRSA